MNKHLQVLRFEGVQPDSLGNYLVGLGLLSAVSGPWPSVRGCWRDGRFVLVTDDVTSEQIEEYLLKQWQPTPYERWWYAAQMAEKQSDQLIWKARSSATSVKVRMLDTHIIGSGRRQFNPVFGTGGNIGKRDLGNAFNNARQILSKSNPTQGLGWLRATLDANYQESMPKLTNAGTWFVYANKTFNSGQSWFRDGRISPWSFLLALEGALLLVGGVAKRLSANARAYAVFPFIADSPSPSSEGEIGKVEAEFWAPLWTYPASLAELRTLLERGQARIGQRQAKAPHEFAIAAKSAGVDAGVAEFVRFVLRETTSSNAYEAIPGERIRVSPTHSTESELIVKIIPWFDRLLDDRKKFYGLRSPVEQAIIRIAERPDEAERWQQFLLLLADTQSRIDRSRELRQRCRALDWLNPMWLARAWPVPPPEIQVAHAIAAIGAGSEMPLLVNVFGLQMDKGNKPVFSGEARPQRAIWNRGDALRLFADVIERRLVDTDVASPLPFMSRVYTSPAHIAEFLSGTLDLEAIARWIPPLSLMSGQKTKSGSVAKAEASVARYFDSASLLQTLFRPLLWPYQLQLRGRPLFPDRLLPRAALARRLLNLLRQGELGEAVQLARSRYLAAGHDIVLPPTDLCADHERLTASLLIPIHPTDVASGLVRWLQPNKNNS